MFYKILIIILIVIELQSYELNNIQKGIIKVAYEAGKKTITSDGMSFENALSGIVMQETTAGKVIIGDNYKMVYYTVINNKYIEINNVENIFEINNQKYLEIKINNKKHKVKVFEKKIKKSYIESSIGPFQIQPKTAIRVINTYYKDKYEYLLKDNNLLINKLFTDIQFSADIAAKYLLLTYEEANTLNKDEKWFRAISRYNGGWNNREYFYNVLNHIVWLREKKYIQ